MLSLDPYLQERVEALLKSYKVPYGAVVAIEPSSGRVLAYVSYSSADSDAGDLALDPGPPAASVFKVVTSAALLDQGVEPERRVCYGGGASRLMQADLEDNPNRDRSCATFEGALGSSVNAVFAKLADRHLNAQILERYASAFGFGQALPFDAHTAPSSIEVPADRLEFARTAAGFWHSHLSPLHGALMAAAIANGGAMQEAYIVDRVLDASGNVVEQRRGALFRQVITARIAKTLARMMVSTTERGTSRRAFHDERGLPFLPRVEVAGKTGTLTGQNPYRAYSWWIGFAPVDTPKIALAALVVNKPVWRIKASFVARETLRQYLAEGKRGAKTTPNSKIKFEDTAVKQPTASKKKAPAHT